MRLRLNLVSNKTLRNKNQTEIFSKILNNNNINKSKIRTELSGDNFNSLRSNNENLNLLNMNNYSILEYNNLNSKEKKKLKRGIHSASLLRSRNLYKKEDQNYPNVIYNIKHIHQIVSFIEKKINSLNDISKERDNAYNTNNYFSSLYNYQDQFTRNGFSTKKGISNEKTELIPYPFKRMQNKIRKYFALSKIKTNFNYNSNNNIKEINKEIIKLPEEQIASGYNFHNKYLLKIRNIKENKFVKNKKEINNKFINKIFRNDTYKGKKILKKDKSVSTENILLKRNSDNKKINSLFNNQLLASLTSYSENRFFLTTGDKNKKNESNRSILVYHKNY